MWLRFANWMLQHPPQWDHIPPEFFEEPPPPEPSISWGQVVFYIVIGLAAQTLFGFWARAKAEDHGVNPWIGFAVGFFLGYLGVRLVPLFKSGTLFHAPARAPLPPPPGMYPPPGPQYGVPQQAPYPPQAPYPQQANYPPPAAPAPRPTAVVAADGYISCTNCGARAKAGKRACMTCGAALPMV